MWFSVKLLFFCLEKVIKWKLVNYNNATLRISLLLSEIGEDKILR